MLFKKKKIINAHICTMCHYSNKTNRYLTFLHNAAVHNILCDILIPTYNTVYTVVRKIRDFIIIYS